MTIIKVGGSQFDLPDLAPRLLRLVESIGTQQVILLAGGGPLVEELRAFDRRCPLPAEQSHRLAMQLLSVTAELLAARDPRMVVSRNFSEVSQIWTNRQLPVFDPSCLPEWEKLPASWDVTSDSLAAWAALQFRAKNLILCKSVDLPADLRTVEQVAGTGLVDPFFPQLAARIPRVEWVNLRNLSASVQVLKDDAARFTAYAGEIDSLSSPQTADPVRDRR